MTPRFRESVTLIMTSHHVPNLITESKVKTKSCGNDKNQERLKGEYRIPQLQHEILR